MKLQIIRHLKSFVFLFILVLVSGCANKNHDTSLEDQFKNPPASCKPRT